MSYLITESDPATNAAATELLVDQCRVPAPVEIEGVDYIVSDAFIRLKDGRKYIISHESLAWLRDRIEKR